MAMRMVQTVCGAVPVTELGHVQMHEHLYVAMTPLAKTYPALCIADSALSRAELINYRAAGGRTVLDAQPLGAGRNAAALHDIAANTGCHVIGVTGYHLAGFYPKDAACLAGDVQALAARYVQDLDAGMDATPYRAGAVKAAIPKGGATGRYRTLLCAAATAAAARDVPLLLHTEAGAHAAEAVRLICDCGLAPKRILVCHADRQAEDYAIHEAIADTGAYLEYDTIGRLKYHSDEAEIRLIRHMLDCGHEDRLLLSLDTTAARLAAYGGEIGLDYLLRVFLPALKSAGVPEQSIQNITQNNPMRVFE